MICFDCVHVIKRQYFKEDERFFCLLDGASVSLRLMKCNKYRRRDAEDVTNATNVGDVKVENHYGLEMALKTVGGVKYLPHETVPDQVLKTIIAPGQELKKKHRGWPKGKKRK